MFAEVKFWSRNYWEYWYRVYLIKNIKLRSITIPNGIYFANSRRITFSVSRSFQYKYKLCYANFCLVLLPVGWMEMKLEMYFWMCFHLHEPVLLFNKGQHSEDKNKCDWYLFLLKSTVCSLTDLVFFTFFEWTVFQKLVSRKTQLRNNVYIYFIIYNLLTEI